MAIGVEKLKDSGILGARRLAAARRRHQVAADRARHRSRCSLPAYAKKYGVDEDEIKEVMTRIAWKNHVNGARNPRAQFRKEVPMETICGSPLVAGQLGIFDCSGVSDGVGGRDRRAAPRTRTSTPTSRST